MVVLCPFLIIRPLFRSCRYKNLKLEVKLSNESDDEIPSGTTSYYRDQHELWKQLSPENRGVEFPAFFKVKINCLQCGKAVEIGNRLRKFCSGRCRKAHYKLRLQSGYHANRCLWCNRILLAGNKSGYCCENHRIRAYIEKMKALNNPLTEVKISTYRVRNNTQIVTDYFIVLNGSYPGFSYTQYYCENPTCQQPLLGRNQSRWCSNCQKNGYRGLSRDAMKRLRTSNRLRELLAIKSLNRIKFREHHGPILAAE